MIVVESHPILDVVFNQSKLAISGSISCIEKDDKKCKGLKVDLLSKGKIVETETASNQGTFKFERVLPGKYQLRVQNPDFCWENSQLDINVVDSDITDIKFKQTGYSMTYDSTHNLDVAVTKSKSKDIAEKMKIVKGTNN